MDGDRQVIHGRGSHKILAEPGSDPPGPDTLMARALRAEVNKAQCFGVDAFGDPTEHARSVAVDAVPHDFRNKTTDLFEAFHAIELGHPDRHLVAADFRDQGGSARMREPRLAGCGADARVALHSRHEQLEVAGWEFQIRIQLANVIELVKTHRLQPGVEGRHDARSYLARAGVHPTHDPKIRQPPPVFFEDGCSAIGRSVIDDDPGRWLQRLSSYTVERTANILGLVSTRRNEHIAPG